MKIKAKDIAAALGISQATVSNALNGRNGVSEELRTQILRTAQEMGYGKSATERGAFIRMLIMKSTGSIVMDTQFFSELFESIQTECHRNGLELIMNHVYVGQSEEWKKQISLYCAEKCAGIIVLATEVGSEVLEYLRNCQSPLIALDNTFAREPINSVVMNNYEAGFLATEELFRCGRRTISHITSSIPFSNANFRCEGYRAALAQYLPQAQPDVWAVRPTIEGAYQDMKALLETGRQLPSAFFACNDLIAIGAIQAMQEQGVRIPADVAIIGMDDTDLCLACKPRLTTIHVFRKEMGRVVVQQLLSAQPAEEGSYLKSHISVSLVRRESV